MKKRVLMALMLCFAVTAAGCANNNTGTTESNSGTAADTAAESAGTEDTAGTEAAPVAERPSYTALDFVTLGQYKGLEVALQPLEVTDEELESEIQNILTQNEKLEEVTEGTVAEGDTVNIDYEGTVDDTPFDGGTDKGYDLTIGSNSFIEGFESGLIGKEVGTDVDVPVTFPDPYQSAELAGKDAVFHVTINSIKKMPELTDELVAEISEQETVDEFRENLRSTLEQQKQDTQQNQKLNDLVSQVIASSTVNDYPQELVDYSVKQRTDYYKAAAEQQGIEFEEFLQTNFQMSEEDYNTEAEATAKQELDMELILVAVAESEGVEITDEQYQAGVEKYAQDMGVESAEALIQQYGESMIRTSLMQDEALKIIEDSAVIIEGEEETQAETADATEAASEDASESESGTEANTDESESESGSESETPSSESESETDSETDSETESQSDSATE